MTAIGYPILGLVSIEKIYHTPKTVFGHHSTHLEVRKNRRLVKVKSAYEPKWPIRPELIPVSVALSD